VAKAKKRAAPAKSSASTSASAIPKNRTSTFVGLVGPGHPGGGMFGGETKWTFTVGLEAWKLDGGPVVREPIIVRASKIGERKVDNLMKQFPKGKLIRFTARPAKTQLGPILSLELAQVRGKVRDKDFSPVAKTLNKPTTFSDRTFGTLRYNREFETFEGELSHKGEKISLCLYTESMDKAQEMLELAKPLWRSRAKWFQEFQALAQKELFDLCQSRRDEDEEPLSTKEFLRLLGNPCSLALRVDDGDLVYELGGYSEDLFGDHGVTAEGNLKDGFTDIYEG
jgi:hypothetical protein